MRKWVASCLLVLAIAVTVGVLSLHAADTIKIGVTAPITGPAAESGRNQLQGIKLAMEEINAAGGVLGKKIELVVEDDQTTNPGIIMAYSKLAGDKDVVGFIGSIRSTQVNAMSPDVMKIGKPVMIGGTDPTLTHMGNPWYFRTRPNDSYSSLVMVDYGINTLKKKKWAIIHSTDTFGTSGKDGVVAALKAIGITPVLVQGYTNNSQDFTPVAMAVKRSGADIMASYITMEPDLGVFAKQLRQLGVDIPWVGSATNMSATALRLAGSTMYGTYTVADFSPDASKTAKAYADKYSATYKMRADHFSAWAYDAMHVLALGINRAKSTDPQKIRQAIIAIKSYPGAEGTYDFDQNGDGLHGYNVVRNDNGNIVFVKRIDFKH
jgi:branched-chain amino acid transport system substrate-binding protein